MYVIAGIWTKWGGLDLDEDIKLSTKSKKLRTKEEQPQPVQYLLSEDQHWEREFNAWMCKKEAHMYVEPPDCSLAEIWAGKCDVDLMNN